MKSKQIYSAIGNITSIYDFLSSVTGYKKSVKYFISQLPFPEDSSIKVLDAGCGTGPYSFAVLEKYKNAVVTAFDLNEKLIAYTQEKARKHNLEKRVHVFTGDIAGQLSEIENQKFDLIITAGVLVYVPHEETVKNLSRFLVPGGYFFDSPNRDSAWGRLICKLYGCKPYPKNEDIEVFEKNGFVLIKDIKVPNTPAASFKDAHIFKKKVL
jgi:ubiquinone/menaquinone biosynthesis C-methylase UbiE